ncbi:MAG: YegS/Rv2252/BmrU family lipid kinase [Aquiluna sp.]|nr:YegS/Rv2252/BmrU family lipid kinase [Aquiluna sp.]
MKPIGVLVNPAANRGRGNQVGEQVFHQLSKAGIPAINLSAESAIAAASKAQVAISDQEISGVIAVGGDGTAQLGVNICVPNQIPLGIVPAGTGNDQARELKITLGDPAAAIENILASLDAPKRVDVMRVVTGEREFWSFGSISAGFDAICAKRANGLKWPKGPNSYVAAMLLELPSFKPIEYRLTVDGEHRNVRAMLCGVANVQNFGGGMRISPESDCHDGELEVFILHEVSRPRLLRIFPTVYKGEHVKFPEIEIFKAKSIRLENDNYPISCDGEIVGHAPFSVEIHPGALQVFSA